MVALAMAFTLGDIPCGMPPPILYPHNYPYPPLHSLATGMPLQAARIAPRSRGICSAAPDTKMASSGPEGAREAALGMLEFINQVGGVIASGVTPNLN